MARVECVESIKKEGESSNNLEILEEMFESDEETQLLIEFINKKLDLGTLYVVIENEHFKITS